MLSSMKIRDDIYWVGALDWNERDFHGFNTEVGITYNAYLILDEKVTLIDTVKPHFSDELLQRISSIIDPAKIDILISNHVEMDHSGGIPALVDKNPNLQIYTSDPAGLRGLTGHYGDLNYHPVKTGDSLSIGKRTLQFVQTPFVHWPDNMVTLDVEDKILFSNDAFGQHYSTSDRYDDETDLAEALLQARKYYANIVFPYTKQARAAMKAVHALGDDAFEMIAPAHGVIWRSHVKEIIDLYDNVLTSGVVKEKAIIAYDTMYGATDKMAHAILDGFMNAGVEAQLYDLKKAHRSDIVSEFLDAKYLCVGTPTFNSLMMPKVSGFLNYLTGFSPKNPHRVGFAFGSYGWAPKGQKEVYSQLEAAKFVLPEQPFALNWQPKEDQLLELRNKVKSLLDAETKPLFK